MDNDHKDVSHLIKRFSQDMFRRDVTGLTSTSSMRRTNPKTRILRQQSLGGYDVPPYKPCLVTEYRSSSLSREVFKVC